MATARQRAQALAGLAVVVVTVPTVQVLLTVTR